MSVIPMPNATEITNKTGKTLLSAIMTLSYVMEQFVVDDEEKDTARNRGRTPLKKRRNWQPE